MDLLDDTPDDENGSSNSPEFSVSEISGAIKRTMEGAFSHIRVRGEVGRVSRPKSGHMYLDLKDDRSVLNGVIWKGVAGRLATLPEEGMEVIATGKITTFGGQSRYQIVIDDIVPAGAGALMAMLEKRKAQLAAEGLFEPSLKKPLPFLPEIIGVVTSPTGAVIRDILHRLRDRFPRKVLIWPVAVQGKASAPEVSRAIAGFNAMTPGGALPRPDLLIVARGGGSLEDLWGFNDEAVVRAAAASDIPLISAVGHETDTTLVDFASDKRAPTPTAAAELAVPVRLDLMAHIDGQGARLSRSAAQAVTSRGQRLRDLSRALPRPESLLSNARQRLDTVAARLEGALVQNVQTRRIRLGQVSAGLRPAVLSSLMRRAQDRVTNARLRPELLSRDIERRTDKLENLSRRLSEIARQSQRARADRLEALDRLRQTLGHTATLSRGYAIVRDGDAVVKTARAAAKADNLSIQFADGDFTPKATAATKPAKPRKPKPAPPEQGTLL